MPRPAKELRPPLPVRPPPRVRTLSEPFLFFGRAQFQLLEEWEFDMLGYGKFVIPVGYVFDRASVPMFLSLLGFTRDGFAEVPALEHDYLCDLWDGASPWLKQALGGVLPPYPPAQFIHCHFHQRLMQEGMRPCKANLMYNAVAYFGPGGFARPSTIWAQIRP